MARIPRYRQCRSEPIRPARAIPLANFVWNERYSVEVPALDDHHRVLLGIATEVHGFAASGKASGLLHSTLDRMDEYARMHFAEEERMLRGWQYPEYAEHKAEHDVYAAKVRYLREKLKHRRPDVFPLANFLRGWWTFHILTSDRQYARFVLRQARDGRLEAMAL